MNDGRREPAVVVIDDEQSVRRALARLLRAYGLLVHSYPSAEAFLDTSRQGDVACLVVDVQMSGMSGLELLELLAASGGAPPSIVLTAYDDAATRERASRIGATFLCKPFESAAILTAVRAHVKPVCR
jgi:FixJ family two-component response regulator